MNRLSKVFLVLLALSLCGCFEQNRAIKAPYTPDVESLSRHEDAPQWFRDAKLGIYFHWGVYSVPAFGSEWYPRNMYRKQAKEYTHHLEKYGDPTDSRRYHSG